MSLPLLLAAGSADFPALGSLHASCFEEAWSAQSLSDLLRTPGCFAFLAVSARPEGFVMARVASDEAEILTLAVGPEYRRRGLATALVVSAAKHASSLGAQAIFLEVGAENAPARRLYAGLGFFETGTRRAYYTLRSRPSEDAIILRAHLPLPAVGKGPAFG